MSRTCCIRITTTTTITNSLVYIFQHDAVNNVAGVCALLAKDEPVHVYWKYKTRHHFFTND